jgi:hypothetical protein
MQDRYRESLNQAQFDKVCAEARDSEDISKVRFQEETKNREKGKRRGKCDFAGQHQSF